MTIKTQTPNGGHGGHGYKVVLFDGVSHHRGRELHLSILYGIINGQWILAWEWEYI